MLSSYYTITVKKKIQMVMMNIGKNGLNIWMEIFFKVIKVDDFFLEIKNDRSIDWWSIIDVQEYNDFFFI